MTDWERGARDRFRALMLAPLPPETPLDDETERWLAWQFDHSFTGASYKLDAAGRAFIDAFVRAVRDLLPHNRSPGENSE
jgi:hypothetical protein